MEKEEREIEANKLGMFGPVAPVEPIKTHEVLLEHTFRVWCRGRGKDYRAELTPTSLVLKPTISSSSSPPPICCICPYSPTCIARCCSGPSIEISGRDVVACRPAPNGGPFLPPGTVGKKKEKKLLKKMDPTVAGLPVFMLVAYPAKSKAGARQKMLLYFHIPPVREDKASMIQDAADNGTGMIRSFKII